VEADPLRNIEEGWRAGTCVASVWSTDGRRKTLTGISAVQVLDDARSWLKYQRNLEAPMRFEPVKGEQVAVPVFHKIGGDTAQTAARLAATERRLLSWESGRAELVDAHGAPIEETQASQYATSEGDKSR